MNGLFFVVCLVPCQQSDTYQSKLLTKFPHRLVPQALSQALTEGVALSQLLYDSWHTGIGPFVPGDPSGYESGSLSTDSLPPVWRWRAQCKHRPAEASGLFGRRSGFF